MKKESVEMPEPTIWPLVLALGIFLLALGLASNLTISLVGGILLLVGIGGWIGQLLPGQGHIEEPLVENAERAPPVQPRPGTVEPLRPGEVGYRFRLPEKIHPISAGFWGGLAGGAVMTIPALAYGIISGNGIWFPVNLLVGMVLPGLEESDLNQLRQFNALALAIGIFIHFIVSTGIGVLYGVLTPTLPGPGGPLVWGGLITPLMWTWGSYGFMGVINPLLQEYVNWPWFVASQLVYGLTTAYVIQRSQKVQVPPAGSGKEAV